MTRAAILLFAMIWAPQLDVSDARGKKAGGVTILAGEPDADGWFPLKVVKAKGEVVLVWPFDGLAKAPDGPEPIPAIVIQRGDEKAFANRRVVAAIEAGVLLGASPQTGFDVEKAMSALAQSNDAFEKGVGLLAGNKAAEAAVELGLALKERQRQLTRIPSEIYPVAILYGRALADEKKFDDAALAFLTAARLRPSDPMPRKLRSAALVQAGKPEAAE
jgi:hypothetical protein